MIVDIPVCPECKKEVSLESASCVHCYKAIDQPLLRRKFSWSWPDRVFLAGVLVLLCCFFLPWMSGRFLYEDNPLSIFSVLLDIVDLEVDFLESYDLLRMSVLVPLFAILLFFMVYQGDGLRTSPFPGILLVIIVLAAMLVFFFQQFQGVAQWAGAILFLAGYGYYLRSCYRRGSLGRISYYALFLFLLTTVFLYLFNMVFTFYLQLESFRISETYGFVLACAVSSLLLIFSVLYFMRSVEDFWVVVAVLAFSAICYTTVTVPLFISGPAKYFSNNLNDIGLQLLVHIRIVGIALIIAIISGVPLGIYITRNPYLAGIVLYISSILITIPSIAMFGFMMPILSSIDNVWDSVSGIGIGVVPAIVALALYSLLPIIRNTYIAIKSVDPATIEAGRGMGMTNLQLLLQLQLPLSAPIIMAGVRTAVVMGIAIAAIAAYIGAGGLGLFVSKGLQMSTNDSVIAGAIAMSLLAIVADIFLARAEDWVTPAGLKIKQAND